MEIIYRKTDEIIPYENNPRVNEASVEALMSSINRFGFTEPIVINKDDVIICGHTRLKAAQKLKMKEVPCVRAENLTEDEERAFRLADNKVAEKSKWKMSALKEELKAIEDIDMSEFGFAVEKTHEETEKEKKEAVSMGTGEKMVTCPHCGELIPESEARREI